MAMTPEARTELRTTVRSLRVHLLEHLRVAVESRYRWSVRAQDAGLEDAVRRRRKRLEDWITDQVRAEGGRRPRTRDDFLCDAVKQAGYTLLNRLVILRLMEERVDGAEALRAPAVVTGGWQSPAYKAFRELAPDLCGDETEGYAFLLQLVFEDLATDLPGLYGPAGVADLIPVPAATLRHVVDAIGDAALMTCWSDDMTLGWVYQYWNDPEREALDAKMHGGGKLEPHEIASKTQMFTERYMVDWLLQNSLGPMWLAMCRKHGWTPDVEADGTLDRLEARRVDWRAKREAGEVLLTELMTLHTESERRWAYYVPQPVLDDVVRHAPETVRDLKILDPAVGSGHFLVVALDLLAPLYREEARHRGLTEHPDWSDRAVVERILSHNLHGIDLDPRAVQIAAAALWLKARQMARDAHAERLNLVASNLRLASLPEDDPTLVQLREEVERETGIPRDLTDKIVHALRGADHLGSLLKIDHAVNEAINAHEASMVAQFAPQQLAMYDAPQPQQAQIAFEAATARASLVERLEEFLSHHTSGDDLGLRLRGEQLASGARFVRLLGESSYDLVVANPPYQGTSKMADAGYIQSRYPLAKADLYAAFLLRGLELVRVGGISAMLTMRNWMFIKQFAQLREMLLGTFDLRGLHDLSSGAFEEIQAAQVVVSVATSVFYKSDPNGRAVGLRSFDDRTVLQVGEAQRKRASTLCQTGRYEFNAAELKVVPKWPLVYWWPPTQRERYRQGSLMKAVADTRKGLCSGNDARYHRLAHEPRSSDVWLDRDFSEISTVMNSPWVPSVMGGKGRRWLEPVTTIIRWARSGLEVKTDNQFKWGAFTKRVQSEDCYFSQGVSFTPIGQEFSARLHRYRSIFTNSGLATFGVNAPTLMLHMNRAWSVGVLNDIAPGIRFDVGDVERLPVFPVEDGDQIVETLERAFTLHESHREPSVEFRGPGPSPWRYAQDWAQMAVDRPKSTPLPAYEAQSDREDATAHLSYALGVALGRFSLSGDSVDPAGADLSGTTKTDMLFFDSTLDVEDRQDGLGHAAARPLHEAWTYYAGAIDTNRKSLREWLTLDFFKDVHRPMYENRPIHWPLSSAYKTFVAWVNIHRFNEQTLRVLLADHVLPTARRLEGELNDLRGARDSADSTAARRAEKRYAKVHKAFEELQRFIANVEQCADRGAPPTDTSCPKREQDIRYVPDLDDGVMINAAALWPLLEPQWKDPKKWWKELSEAKDRKDYDWSHLAMRYWPDRVDAKCKDDPSLGVAHGCFWRYHPARAWAWELRLQDEIDHDFRIEEAPYRPGGKDVDDTGDGPHRDAWLREHPYEALAAVETEARRRMKKQRKARLEKNHKEELQDRGGSFEMRILETGLWSVMPLEVWDMELRLAEWWRSEVRLLAPDEPAARSSFVAEHPQKISERAALLASLVPFADMLDDADEENEAVNDEGASDVEADAESEDA